MDVRLSVDSKKAQPFVATKSAHSRMLVKQVFALLADRLRNQINHGDLVHRLRGNTTALLSAIKCNAESR
jgi:hypothetical protein